MKPETQKNKKGLAPQQSQLRVRYFAWLRREPSSQLTEKKVYVSSRFGAGFSLIETLVAIIVLISALLGPLALATYSIHAASASEHDIVAYNLAQGAMELVRNKRDANFIAGVDWRQGFNVCNSNNGCTIDITTGDVQVCPSICPPLRFDAFSGLYSYDSADPKTIFTSSISIVPGADYDVPPDGKPDEIKVTVTVTWKERTYNRSFNLETHLFNWK